MPFNKGSNSKHIQQMFSLYPNNCIIGIYNTLNKTIHLALSMDNKENTSRVWLLRSAENNNWSKGWIIAVDRNKAFSRGVQLSQEKIDEFNAHPTLIPRLYAFSEEVDANDCNASHDYFLFEVLKDRKNIEDYLGFSLTTKDGKLDEFVPVSGLLNNRDEKGKMVRDSQGNTVRKRGATLPPQVNKEIVEMIGEAVLAQEQQVQSIRDRFFIHSETKSEAPEPQVMRPEGKK